jgi:hypothetical protein
MLCISDKHFCNKGQQPTRNVLRKVTIYLILIKEIKQIWYQNPVASPVTYTFPMVLTSTGIVRKDSRTRTKNLEL